MEKEYYIIDKNWLNSWKKYSKYEIVKSNFDKIVKNDEKQFKQEVEQYCQNMICIREINDSKNNCAGEINNT